MSKQIIDLGAHVNGNLSHFQSFILIINDNRIGNVEVITNALSKERVISLLNGAAEYIDHTDKGEMAGGTSLN